MPVVLMGLVDYSDYSDYGDSEHEESKHPDLEERISEPKEERSEGGCSGRSGRSDEAGSEERHPKEDHSEERHPKADEKGASLSETEPNEALIPSTSGSSETSPGIDFFGLGNLAPRKRTRIGTSLNRKMPQATAQDPFPGYTLVDGTWTTEDEGLYKATAESMQTKGINVALHRAENNDRYAELREKWGREADEEAGKTASKRAREDVDTSKVPQNKPSYLAKTRHQLTAMVQEAVENRDMLEERISRQRASYRNAGRQYGF